MITQETPPPTEDINDFCKVSLDDFISNFDIKVDLFIKLSDKKFIKVAKKGGELSQQRMDQYKQKGVGQLYVKRDEFHHLVDFDLKLTKAASASSAISIEKKQTFLTHTAGVIMENTFVNDIDPISFNDAKEFVTTSIEVVTQDNQVFSLLDALNSHSDYLYAHSLGVSMYSVMIAKQLDWNSSKNLFNLSFGGLMHDIGKKEIDPQILAKSRSDLSFEEIKLLESHTIRGKEILGSLRTAPSEAVAIAHEHHETSKGHGYPRQMSKHKIHPMARIVAVANEFCEFALKGPDNPGMKAGNAFMMLEEEKSDGLDSQFVKALRELIQTS